jgi:1-acyl-sn-glycerol-3-phosphate acyltransferase
MIYPKKNFFIYWFFHHYIHYIVNRNFQEVKFNALPTDQNKSVLLLANHFSWWDGFLLYVLNERLFKKKFHIMILEETVKTVAFMKYLGAFSIKKNSRSALDSLSFAAGLLNNPENLVLIFPQGRIYSNFTDHVHFENGLSRVIIQTENAVQTVFAATFVENFKYKQPMATIYLEQAAVIDAAQIGEAYQDFYTRAKKSQTQIIF